MENYLGEIRAVGFNYAPRNWAFCHGQILSIQSHEALFSLLGTYYGGDGRTTFALPDLRGRAPIGEGAGPNLTEQKIAATGGGETVTLTDDQKLPHSILRPYIVVNYIIALEGIYPSRS